MVFERKILEQAAEVGRGLGLLMPPSSSLKIHIGTTNETAEWQPGTAAAVAVREATGSEFPDAQSQAAASSTTQALLRALTHPWACRERNGWEPNIMRDYSRVTGPLPTMSLSEFQNIVATSAQKTLLNETLPFGELRLNLDLNDYGRLNDYTCTSYDSVKSWLWRCDRIVNFYQVGVNTKKCPKFRWGPWDRQLWRRNPQVPKSTRFLITVSNTRTSTRGGECKRTLVVRPDPLGIHMVPITGKTEYDISWGPGGDNTSMWIGACLCPCPPELFLEINETDVGGKWAVFRSLRWTDEIGVRRDETALAGELRDELKRCFGGWGELEEKQITVTEEKRSYSSSEYTVTLDSISDQSHSDITSSANASLSDSQISKLKL